MSSAVISQELRLFARTRWPLANDKYRKDRLAELLDLTKRRVKSFWEASDVAVPRAIETIAIEKLIGHRIGDGLSEKATHALRSSQENHRLLEARLASVEALLVARDAERNRGLLAARGARAGDEGEEPFGRGHADGPAHQLDLFDHFRG